MQISIPEEILDLAEIFEKKKTRLFLVGGFVRSAILHIGREDDIDLASSMPPEKVVAMLSKTDFLVRYKNQKTGILEIEKNGKCFEHATFRSEAYSVAGEHMPCDVLFHDSLEKDSDRRDFTCNAIYMDVLTRETKDPQKGILDLKNNRLRAIGVSSALFKNDAERILRMVRIACSCGFDIEHKTYLAAKQNVFRLKFLSKARIQKEVKKMLTSDEAYPCLGLRSAHVRAVNMLMDLGADKYIFPQIANTFEKNPAFSNGQSVRENAKLLVKNVSPQNRLLALLCHAGIEQNSRQNLVQKGYGAFCSEEAAELAKQFGMSQKEQQLIVMFAQYHENASKDKISLGEARKIVLQAKSQAGDLLEFFVAARSAWKKQKFSHTKSEQNLQIAIKQAYKKMFALETNQIRLSKKMLEKHFPNLQAHELKKIKQKLLEYGAKKGTILTEKQNLRLARKVAKYFVQTAQNI